MKLAFSTLGVPGLPLTDVLGLATAHGYHGVELRAHAEEPVHPGLTPEQRADVAAEVKAAGLEILGLAGYVRVAAPGDDDAVVGEIRALLDLARDIGAPFVRVSPGGDGGEGPEEADATAARRLGTAAEHASDVGVRILLETHDSHPTGADAMRVLGLVGHRQVGALWDVMHTWLGGEQPVESFAALSPHLGYVQVKDIASADDRTPLRLGAGVLPLTDVVETLSRHGWDGWLCWEYEKRRHPDAADFAELLTPGREHLARLLNESA
ncbi:sugar phosphate isomerase/epimerase family protein [Streptomyces pilosus]|uniref:sugar phosphate isomerase/epimerase family protein n=1 Tax=Streptomyces pilosus TaxID=28893 RepID=UPI0036FBE6F9